MVYDMAVELHILEEVHMHIVAVAAEVVARKVNKHHMLGILLSIVAQALGIPPVLLHIARAACRSCNGVDERLVANNTIMGLRTGTEDTETSKVEIEQIWTGVDTSQ